MHIKFIFQVISRISQQILHFYCSMPCHDIKSIFVYSYFSCCLSIFFPFSIYSFFFYFPFFFSWCRINTFRHSLFSILLHTINIFFSDFFRDLGRKIRRNLNMTHAIIKYWKCRKEHIALLSLKLTCLIMINMVFFYHIVAASDAVSFVVCILLFHLSLTMCYEL